MKILSIWLAVTCSFIAFAQAKRLAPKPVKPVSNAGLRYELLTWASESQKMSQNGGFIRVVNIRNGLPVCTKQVYETKYDKNLEHDVQDNFITGLNLENGQLIINSEKLDAIKKPLVNFYD